MLRITNDGVVVLFGYSYKGNKHTICVYGEIPNVNVKKFEQIIDRKELILRGNNPEINFGHIQDCFRLSGGGIEINSIYLMRDSRDLVRVREVGDFFFAERWPYSPPKIFVGDYTLKEETAEGAVICLYRSGVEIGQFGPFSGGIFQNSLVRNQDPQQKLMVH